MPTNQSNVIVAFLAVAFVIFITMRGEIGVYMGFLLSTPKQSAPATTPVQNNQAQPAPTKTGDTGSFNVADAASLAMVFL